MAKQSPKVLIVPGYTNSGPKHWQTLWQEKHPEYTRVEQRDWNNPQQAEWVETLNRFIAKERTPLVLVAHSLGCITIAHWVEKHQNNIRGALLVAPADVERPDALSALQGFAPIPVKPLPFPGIVVASSNDPYLNLKRAEFLAKNWGSRFVNIGPCGHIDTAAGFGPWRQGEVLLQQLLIKDQSKNNSLTLNAK
jgi:predicted alpha/beta hydrolase family esterase